ncbi:L-2-hydroxyglutarate oxidase [Solicola gregarius]|uniref:L-2-hydroxyglutarate oxidase n=1 Tax=Solicola gregarius TaxID=2908642 RepID=A0AA46YLR7_9ACTN|nr:L-2-hydroxyglutarate oxidase [Solicola gregarius]UYM07230.1 L-2-hydroxyglutarate oxidase [Solicola gregarius]
MRYDYCVVGGGIVGLSTARELLLRRPGASLVLLEKESGLARHQTGHNSGVIHSGIYYEPGSFKAELCRRGVRATREFCSEHGIPVASTGKLIVATNATELGRLSALEDRAVQNSIEVQRLDAAELRAEEPNVAGDAALLVPSTACVDYGLICEAMRTEIEKAGGEIVTAAEVTAIREDPAQVLVSSTDHLWQADQLVVCGGLQSDRLARMAGVRTSVRILPFRGEYYRLRDQRSDVVSRMIYPVPDPALPFLGVHLTPTLDGGVTVGPNAVLGLSREGYRRGAVSVRDVREIANFPGFWRLARTYAAVGAAEQWRSLSRRAYLEECRRYCPSLTLDDLLPAEAGIRAQAVDSRGTLLHDFAFERTGRMLHVLNAPSPAATSAMPIGELIAGRVLEG